MRTTLGLLLALGATPALAQSSAVDVLIRQAERWLGQDRTDMAASSIERALAAEPRNTAALAVAARIEAARNNRTAAAGFEARLREAGGTVEQRAQAEGALRGAAVDRAAVEDARRLSRDGRTAEAAARWRAIFGNQRPTEQYSTEYYQALAATQGGRDEGVQGLQRLAEQPNAAPRARLAAAQNLTFQPATRAEGIRRLTQLVDNPEIGADARAAWRQALVWSSSDPAAATQIEAYLRRYPDDTDLRRAQAAVPVPAAPDPGFAARREGFDRLETGNLRDATRQFEAALTANPADADALGGLGIVRLREGRNADARGLLERAIAANPGGSAQWQPALDGAAYGQELLDARAAIRRDALDEADTILRSAGRRQVADRTDAETLLGELALRRGDASAAEQRFRTALARRPGFPPAQQGLNQALRAQGRLAEAPVRGPRAADVPDGPSATPGEAGRLRAEAARTSDPGVAAALLRQASQQAPEDPWLRLDLARALRRQGNAQEGRVLVEELAARSGRRDDFYAAALLADEDGRAADAEALLGRIPTGSRTPDMARLGQRLRNQAEVQRAVAQLAGRGVGEGRTTLLTLAARPDPTGATAAAVIRALGNANDRFGAAEAARIGEAANRGAGAGARIAIAGALLGAGLEAEALAVANAVESSNPNAEQRRDIASLRGGIAVRSADRLNEGGEQARGFEALRPVLERDPENGDARLALARLYQGGRQPGEALRIAEAVLTRNPRNLEARGGAVDAAIALRDRARAEALVAEGQELHPRDSRMALMEARMARAFSQESRALRALELAQQQRRAELGQPTGIPVAGGNSLQNPFLRPGAATPLASVGGAVVPSDRIARDIATEMAALERQSGAAFTLAAGARTRTGSSGLDRLTEITAPQAIEFSPGGIGGRLTATVTGTSLQAGSLGNNPQVQQRFGSNAAFGSAQAPRTTAAGASVSLSYTRGDWLRADVGSSPLGFAGGTQVLGGLEVAPLLGENLRLRVTAERRSVTDSLLSWAGQTDRVVGRSWGQVVRTGGRAQLETTIGPATFYAGGGYATYDGNNVAANNRTEAGVGFSYPVLRRPDGGVTVGTDLVYFAFDRNLRYFSLGHGGYYSPQSFYALNVPVDYRGRSGDVSYRLGATAGYAVRRESSAPFFPLDPDLQGRADARAARDPTALSRYPAQAQQSFVGNVRADADYALTPQMNLGASFRYDKAANWEETRILVRLNGRF